MKASKMTNEQIADAIEPAFCASSSPFGAMMREAAARLRAFSVLTTHTDNSKVIAELQRRLKVAEDALTELHARCVASVHDGTIDPYEALKIAEDTLAAIREKGARRGNR